MNLYDRYVLNDKPLMYLSAGESQKGSSVASVINNSTVGQPIVPGKTESFMPDIEIDTNEIIGIEGRWLETVLYVFDRPTDEEALISATNSDAGLFLTPSGLSARIECLNDFGYTEILSLDIAFNDWKAKKYVRLYFEDDGFGLIVNGVHLFTSYTGTVDIPDDLVIGGFVLMDSVAVFNSIPFDKTNIINQSDYSYKKYAESSLGGRVYLFDNVEPMYRQEVSSSSFIDTNGYYSYTFQPPLTNDDINFLSIKIDNESVVMEVSIDLVSWTSFNDFKFLDDLDAGQAVYIRYEAPGYITTGSRQDFTMSIKCYASQEFEAVMALLTVEAAVLPNVFSESLVNCPDGIALRDTVINGVWRTIPKTIEMIVRVHDVDYTIFSSTDGEASSDALTYTAYLNGENVVSLNLVQGQWYVLTLVDSSPAATNFVIGGDCNIDILFLASYEDELTEDQIENNYSILTGSDNISVIDTLRNIEEATNAYSAYSYTWDVISSR